MRVRTGLRNHQTNALRVALLEGRARLATRSHRRPRRWRLLPYRGPWENALRCAPGVAHNISGYYALCDPRLHLRWSTAAPRSGRHSLRLQIPSRSTVAQHSFPQAGYVRTKPTCDVEIWARSSPAAVNATVYKSTAHRRGAPLPPDTVGATASLRSGVAWTRVSASFENATRGDVPLAVRLVLAQTVGVTATVWADDAKDTLREIK